ncbi:hypothetical protein EAS61_23420 [Bradyrhizobium zhanjiangense]|uniref:Uncharacterized protein n=1 Tax=Bradyrhizobium zhanjiangense TaxID=1325107 RepID=A0A4Q0QKC3_9BRAD|nr:hypothetical protein EAS61_23420 [Bradyrhizobium zhanjiangense]
MPREMQTIKNKTGGIEHIRTLRFVFLPPAGICPRRIMRPECGDTTQPALRPVGVVSFELNRLMKSEGRS